MMGMGGNPSDWRKKELERQMGRQADMIEQLRKENESLKEETNRLCEFALHLIKLSPKDVREHLAEYYANDAKEGHLPAVRYLVMALNKYQEEG